jgi:FlaA1/EpsC-like NDP-sugar epimerase
VSVKVLPVWTILLFDFLLVFFSILLAYVLRYSFVTVLSNTSFVDTSTLWAILVNAIFFRVFHTYSNVLRFSSFVDIMRIFISLTSGYAILMALSFVLGATVGLTTVGVFFMAYLINVALMICSRVAIKVIFDMVSFDSRRSRNVFVYGAREVGVNIAKSLRVIQNNQYRLRGFIADEPELIDKTIMGVKVYANDSNLLTTLSERDVHTIIISPAKMDMLKRTNLTDTLLANNIKLLTAASLSEYSGIPDGGTVAELKEIQIEDLLQRDPINIDIKKVAAQLEGKRVLITGAAGSIGSEIMRQVAAFNPYKLILVDQAETPLHDIRLELQDRWRNIDAVTAIADISNTTRMELIFKEYRPQYVFHAAAYKHVPMMEDNVSESIQVNVLGTRTVADLSVKYGVDKFVMISTDKAVNPTNVMGASKRICEIYIQSLSKKLQRDKVPHATQFITTRFGNVLGSNGSVIPRFRDQIRRGGPVTVTHPEIIRYFMTIPEACRLVLEAGCMGNGGEIYIFDMGEPVKIVDLAQRMISLSGRTDVRIEFTGLRHGEKLYEELLSCEELTKPTSHDKIRIANVREYDFNVAKRHIQALIDLSYTYDQMQIVAAMKEIVPEFISKNSYFEVLDAPHVIYPQIVG